MRLSHIREEIEKSYRAFGFARTVADISMRALNRLVMFRVMKGIAIESGDLPPPIDDPRYKFGRIDEETLRVHARTPEYELSHTFLDEALGRGDECYGFLCDGELAAYTWYTRRPTAIELPNLGLQFSDRYVYIYKGFTHPKHRGHRLHSAGMAQALPVHLARGRLGMVSYVELTNFAQRHSAMRAGFHYFGTLIISKFLGSYFLWASEGCRRYAFFFEELFPKDGLEWSGPRGETPSSESAMPQAPAPNQPAIHLVH